MEQNGTVERLADAGMRQVRNMDLDDVRALKLCLLSTGALVGLSVKGSFSRRLLGLACGVLSAGLAIPLTAQFLEELDRERPAAPAAEEAPEGEPLAQ